MRTRTVLVGILSLLLLVALTAACGGGGGNGGGGSTTVEGKDDFSFGPSSISATAGEALTVIFKNTGALEHDFVIDELNVDAPNVPGGGSHTVTFTPASAGTYAFYCSVPGHREAGMEGTLTVQ